jgi:hypothetical protein
MHSSLLFATSVLKTLEFTAGNVTQGDKVGACKASTKAIVVEPQGIKICHFTKGVRYVAAQIIVVQAKVNQVFQSRDIHWNDICKVITIEPEAFKICQLGDLIRNGAGELNEK